MDSIMHVVRAGRPEPEPEQTGNRTSYAREGASWARRSPRPRPRRRRSGSPHAPSQRRPTTTPPRRVAARVTAPSPRWFPASLLAASAAAVAVARLRRR